MILQRPYLTLFVLVLNFFNVCSQNSEIYSVPGTYTWTVPPCVYEVTVEAWGGGGGGGAVWSRFSPTTNSSPSAEACTAAGGGGGGGYARRTYMVNPGEVYTITVGAGGVGGAVNNSLSSNRAQSGSDGGTSTFSGPATTAPGTLTAFGGDGGSAANFLRSNCNGGCWINHEGVNGSGGQGGDGANGTVMFSGGNGASGAHSGSTNDKSGAGGGGAGSSSDGGNASSITNGGSGGNAGGGNGANGIVQPYGNGYLGTNGNNGNVLAGGGGGACGHNRKASSDTHRSNVGGNGARGEVRIFFNLPNLPEPIFTQVPPICSGGSVGPLPNTSNNGFTGSWSPAINNSATTTYIFTPDPNGPCADTTSMTIVVNAPILPLFDQPGAICSGDQLNALPTISNNGINGTWSPALNNTLTTTYFFTPDAGQCASSADLTVTVNPVPVITDQPQHTGICANGTATLEVTANAGPYQWQYYDGVSWQNVVNGMPGGFSYSNSNSAILDITTNNALCDLPYEYRVIVGSSGCELISAVAEVSVIRAARIAPTGPQCSGTELNFEACPAGALYTWNVSPPSGTQASPLSGTGQVFSMIPMNTTASNQQFPVNVEVEFNGVTCFQMFNPTIVPTPDAGSNGILNLCSSSVPTQSELFDALNGSPDAGGTWTNSGNIYTYTVIGSGTCPSASAEITVTNDQVVPTFSSIAPICEGDLLNPLPGISLNGITGSWSPMLNNTVTTTYTFTPDPGQCALSATLTISVNASQTPVFDPLMDVCQFGQPPILSSVSNNGFTGNWSSAVNTSQPGTFTYIFIPDAGQCAEETVLELIVHPNPLIDAGGDIEICEGNSITLSAQGGAVYNWSNSVLDGVPFYPPLGTTVYAVTGISSEGCTETDQLTVTVFPGPNIEAGADQFLCEGESVVLSGSGGVSYNWDNNVQNNLSFQPSPGTTIYTVTGTDINGCTGTDQVMVQVTGLSQPIFEYSGGNCIPATLSLYNTTPNSQNCSWIVSGMGTFSSCDSISVILDQPGCYDVSLTTAVNGCPSTVTVDDLICVDAFPIADFSFEPGTVSTLNTEVEFQNESSNANSFVWDFGDGSSANYLSDPVHVFPDNTFGTYEIILVAMSENGCSDTVTAFISVEEELIYYVPNTFTPDGDMYNQVFEPVFSSGFDPYDYHLMIYDRWGEVVFESFDHQIGWDGTYGAQKASAVFNCPDGTYTWRLEFSALSNDQRFVEVGHVTLLR